MMPVIAGGAVVADALAVFDAAIADAGASIIVVPVLERRQIIIYRKLLTKLAREEYGLGEEVYLASGKALRAGELIGGDE